MQSSDKAYFSGVLGVLTSRVISIVAGVLSLWFLTEILGTEEFAGYSVAMSIVILLGYSIGLGIERSMLLRIGELAPEAKLKGARMMQRIALVAGVLAGMAALAIVVGTDPEASAKHRFLAAMAPVVPATALSLVMITWYQGNHRVGVSQVMLGLNDGTRSLAFGVCLFLGLGAAGVAWGAILGALAPLLVLGLRAMGNTEPEPSRLGLSDLVSGVQFLTMRLSKMGLHHLDIIAMGFYGSTTGTAQYAVAVRFSVLVESGQTAFAPTFTPRVRRHLNQGRLDLAEREYKVSRVLGFSAALALSIGFAVLGAPVLRLFGDFGVDFAAFMVLVGANVLVVGVGLHSAFLSMTEHLWRSTAIRVVSIAIFVACLVILVPRFDALGAALSYLVAILVHEISGVLILRRRIGIHAFDAVDGGIVGASSALFCAIGLGWMPQNLGVALLMALLAGICLRHRDIMANIAQGLLRLSKRD